jgi:hypothetical protein
MGTESPRSGALERTSALTLRTLHLVAMVGLGSALLGAPVAPGPAAAGLLLTGLLLLALDLRARRIALGELAGGVVLLKLAATAWMAWTPAHAPWLFWTLVVLSSLSSHAPKTLRHWRPRR